MNRKGYWSLAALALILLLTGQWWLNRAKQLEVTAADQRDQSIDYALSDFNAEFFNANGELELMLQAPSLEHHVDTRQAFIEQPVFRLPGQQPDWQGSARTGLIDRNLHRLELNGGVVIRQAHPKGEILLKSDHIRYDRTRQKLHSPGTARISQAGTELHGGTLTLWLEEQRAELHNDVQGTFRTTADSAADESSIGADQRN